jgi:hypothetical protein
LTNNSYHEPLIQCQPFGILQRYSLRPNPHLFNME